MTKLKDGAWAVILVGAVAFTFWQHQQIKQLIAERVVLREQVGQVALQRDEIQRLAVQIKANVEGSEADRAELMQLRAQASRLRQVEQENAQLKIERQRLVSQVSQAKQADALSGQPQSLPSPEVKIPPLPPSVTDLGVVELSDRTPMRLDLGEGKECVVTATVLNDGQLQMVFTFESQIDGVQVQTKQTATVLPGRQVAQVIDGVDVAFTPALKTQ